MLGRWLTLLCGLGVSSCVSETPIALDALDEDTAVVTVVLRDSTGTILEGVALKAPFDSALGFGAQKSQELRVTTYSEAALSAIGVRLEDVPPRSVVRAAEPCERAFPAGNAHVIEGESARPAASTGTPVTADWMNDLCPDSAEDLLLSVVPGDFCAAGCTPQIERTRCRLVADLTSCGLDRVASAVWPNGALCVEEDAGQCQPVDVAASVPSVALGCASTGEASCRVLGMEVPRVRGELRSVQLSSVMPYELVLNPTNLHVDFQPRHNWLGHGSDFLVREDHILVSAVAPGRADPYECINTPEGRIHRVDRRTLEVTETATVPGCLMRISEDPHSNGFVGVFARSGMNYFGRFDERFRVVEETAMRAIQHVPDIVYLPSHDAFVLVGNFIEAGFTHRVFFAFDGPTLQERARRRERSAYAYVLRRLSDDSFLVTRSDDDTVEVFVLETEGGVSFSELPTRRTGYVLAGRQFSDVHVRTDAANSDAWLVTALQALPFVAGETEAYFPNSVTPTRILPWREDLFLLTVHDVDAVGTLMAYDARAEVVIPEARSEPLGIGPVGRWREEDGTYWLLYPWEGRLVEFRVR